MSSPIQIVPSMNWPRSVRPGESYELSIDLTHSLAPDQWPYELEEYPLTCLLETQPLFDHKPLGDSTILLHRFGGSYGGVRFLLRAAEQEQQGQVRVTFLNGSGLPVHSVNHEVQIQGGPAAPTYRTRVARRRSYGAEVPPSRVNIRYVKYIGDTMEKVELPFKLLLLGDDGARRAQADEDPQPIGSRRRIQIDRQNFADVMAEQNLGLELGVRHHLSLNPTVDAENTMTLLDLRISSLETLTPDGIVGAWPPLRRAARLRRGLELLSKQLLDNRPFQEHLIGLLEDPGTRDVLREDLQSLRSLEGIPTEDPLFDTATAPLPEQPSLQENLSELDHIPRGLHRFVGFFEDEPSFRNRWRILELHHALFHLLETFEGDDVLYFRSLEDLSDQGVVLSEELPPDLKWLVPERISAAIKDLDQKMTAQVDEILHQPDVQALESFWRGLKLLIDRTDFRRNIKIDWLPVSKQELIEDFEKADSFGQSGLYQHVNDFEYDQAGGQPFAAMIGLFEVDHRDVNLVQRISEVAEHVQAPFVASAAPSFFGLSSMADLPNLKGKLTEVFSGPELSDWNAFRDTEASRFITLTLPRFLLRVPYGADSYPAKSFGYEEAQDEDEHHLWGPSSLALAACMTRSFADNGWAVNIRGQYSGGLVEDLPMIFPKDRPRPPILTESLLTGHLEAELQAQGLAPLSFLKSHDYACFFEVPTLQKPLQHILEDDDFTIRSPQLHVQLPYLFFTTRFAHYIKVVQRENIGSTRSREDLEAELERYLLSLTTEMPQPAAELKARCPLTASFVRVVDLFATDPKAPNFFGVQIYLRPHFGKEFFSTSLYLPRPWPES